MNNSLINKYKGMLWGLVVGDCLGSPIQFGGKDDHPYISKMEPAVGIYGRDLPKGYWTDDSSMAFCIMESFIRQKHFDLNDIANNFIRWYDDGFLSSVPGWAFDIGGATDNAIENIKNGSLVNGEEDSQGNGSLMRYAPAFILESCGKGENICRKINDLTHNSDFVRKQMKRLNEALEAALSDDKSSISTSYTDRADVPNSGWSKDTVDAALWAFCSTDNFKDGMLAAVNLGGDSDSIAAVYGQVAGAYYGFAAIPQEWICDVKDHQWADDFINQFIGDSMKIDTLLNLWKFRCEHYNGRGLDTDIMKWQKDVKQKKEKLVPDIDSTIAFAAESLFQPEPFTTKILYKLLSENKSFRKDFLNELGVDYDSLEVKSEYHKDQNIYDIAFLLNEELLCIVENKLYANFSAATEDTSSQLDRYIQDLPPNGTLATLTVFNMDDNNQVSTVKKSYKDSEIRIINLYWHKIVKLVADYAVEGKEGKIFRQAKELFNSEYFLLQDNMSQKITENYRDVLIEKIKNIAGEEICHQSKHLGHRSIVLRQKKYPKVDFCGGLMALSIWLDCYSITGGKNYPKDPDAPKELTNKAFPYFDITLRCYYQLEDKKISEEDFDKIAELQKKGYEPLRSKSFYHGSPKQEFLYKSFAEVTGNRISDEESLKEQIYNADSELWTFLQTEISNWEEIVWR